MLIDSGAEICAIYEKYQAQLMEDDPKTPTVPLTGLYIYNAIGDKTTKATTQMLLPININGTVIQTPFIIIKHLNEKGILGNDFLETHGALQKKCYIEY